MANNYHQVLHQIKQLLKAFFTLSKGEQRAIIIVLTLIFLVSIFNFILPYFIQPLATDYSDFEAEIKSFREEQQTISDSIKIIQLQNRGEIDLELARQKLKPFYFDPNNLPVELWKKLGLTEKQIKVIKNYEAKGGTFTSKSDVRRMYSISEAEYQVLEPYIRIRLPFKTAIEGPLEDKQPMVKPKKKPPRTYSMVEINSADTNDLTRNLHLPAWLANRVLKYRDLLGGYAYTSQLHEVYGFDSSRFQKIQNHIIADPSAVKKLKLNSSTFKELLRHPYLSYEITKAIVNYRGKNGHFKHVDELVNQDIISESKYVKLKPYITVDASE